MIKPIDFNLPPGEEPDDVPEAAVPHFDPSEFNVEYEFDPPPVEIDIRSECEAFFAPGGPLKAAAEYGGRPYEFRPQQLEMAGAIADALRCGDNLCIEAPTGVGKSFAYLIPLIYRSRLAARPATAFPHPSLCPGQRPAATGKGCLRG